MPQSIGPQKVLILDLDGRLYDDACNIEQQIRDGYDRFGHRYLFSPEQWYSLHDNSSF